MSSPTQKSELSLDQIRQAIALKEQIAALESQLPGILAGPVATHAQAAHVTTPLSPPVRRGRGGPRIMSPEARKRIAAAQKARWAKFHAAKGGAVPVKVAATATTPGRKAMSAEGRARIAAAAKARWAKFRRVKKGK
jgi:hypothetical protein